MEVLDSWEVVLGGKGGSFGVFSEIKWEFSGNLVSFSLRLVCTITNLSALLGTKSKWCVMVVGLVLALPYKPLLKGEDVS